MLVEQYRIMRGILKLFKRQFFHYIDNKNGPEKISTLLNIEVLWQKKDVHD